MQSDQRNALLKPVKSKINETIARWSKEDLKALASKLQVGERFSVPAQTYQSLQRLDASSIVPNYEIDLNIVDKSFTFTLNTDLPSSVSDAASALSVMTTPVVLTYSEHSRMHAVRHDASLLALTGFQSSDVTLQEAYGPMNDSNDLRSPDVVLYVNEEGERLNIETDNKDKGVKVVIEFTTNHLDDGAQAAWLRKLNKYQPMLHARSAMHDCRTIFYIVAVGPSVVYHNLPRLFTKQELSGLQLGQILGESASSIAISKGIHKGDERSSQGFSVFLKNLELISKTMTFPTDSDPCTKDNVKKTRITKEFLEKVNGIQVSDESLLELYKKIKETSLKRAVESLKKEKLQTYSAAEGAFLLRWGEKGYSKNLDDTIKFFPMVAKDFSRPLKSDPIPLVTGDGVLQKIWMQALLEYKKNPSKFRHEMTDDMKEVMKNSDNPVQTYSNRARKEDLKRFNMPQDSLTEVDRLHLASRGVQGKEFSHVEFIANKRKEKQKALPPEMSTKKIDTFCEVTYPAILKERGVYKPCWKNLEELDKLRNFANEVNVDLNFKDKTLSSDDLFLEFRSTTLFCWMSLNTYIFEELNGNFNSICEKDQFLLLNPVRGMWIVAKATGSSPDDHIFYSVLFMKAQFHEIQLADLFKKPHETTDQYYLYNFYSITPDKMNSRLSLDIGSFVHHIGTHLTWGERSSVSQKTLLSDKPYNCMAAIKLLVKIADDRGAAATLFQIRYPCMERFSGNPFRVSHPYKILSKLEPPRSPLALWATQKTMSFCKITSQCFLTSDKKTFKENAVEAEYISGASPDMIEGLNSPWFPQLKVPTLAAMLDGAYLGHLKDKNAIGYQQALKKTVVVPISMENRLAKTDESLLGMFDQDLPERSKNPGFNASLKKHAGYVVLKKLNSVHGDFHRVYLEALYKNLKKITMMDVGTMKASTRVQDWSESSFQYQIGKNHDETTKVVTALIQEVLAKLLLKNDKGTTTLLDNLLGVLELVKQVFDFKSLTVTLTASVFASMFPKRQPGPAREIAIADIFSRILQMILECISHTLNTFLDPEMIARDPHKEKITSSHLVTLDKAIEDLAAKEKKSTSEYETHPSRVIADASKWGPSQVIKSWMCHLSILIPPEVFMIYANLSNRFTDKVVLIPDSLLASFIADPSRLESQNELNQLKKEFLGFEEPTCLLEKGSYAISSSMGMFQGYLQKGSSTDHAVKNMLCTDYNQWLVATVNNTFKMKQLEESKKKLKEELKEGDKADLGERLRKSKADPTFHEMPGLGVKLLLETGQVSSDDSLECRDLVCLKTKDSTILKSRILLLEVMVESSLFCMEMFGLTLSAEKSCHLNQLLCEFNSVFRAGNTISYASIKFLDAALHIIPTESLVSRLNNISNSISTCLKYGVSIFGCNQLQQSLFYMHYRLMGCNVSQFFSHYISRLKFCFHPALGGYLMQPSSAAGLGGFNLSYYWLLTNVKSSRLTESFLSGGLDFSDFDTIHAAVSIKAGGHKAFTRFKNTLPKLDAWAYLEENPVLHYIEPKSLMQTEACLISRYTSSSVRLTFANLGVAKVHVYGFYMLCSPAITLIRPGARKEKSEFVKLSLIDVVDLVSTALCSVPELPMDIVSLVLFPLKENYDLIIEACKKISGMRAVTSPFHKKRVVTLLMHQGASRTLIPILQLVKTLWFGESKKFSNGEMNFSTDAWKAIYSWLDFSSLENTLRDSPFLSHTSLAAFIRSKVNDVTKIEMSAPISYGMPVVQTIYSALKSNNFPGQVLVHPGSLMEGKDAELEKVNAQDSSLSFFSDACLCITGPGDSSSKMTILELMCNSLKWNHLDPESQFRSLSYRGQIAYLIYAYFRLSKLVMLTLLTTLVRGSFGYWVVEQAKRFDGVKDVWVGHGRWIGTIDGYHFTIDVIGSKVSEIRCASASIFQACQDSLHKLLESFSIDGSVLKRGELPSSYSFMYKWSERRMTLAVRGTDYTGYCGVHCRPSSVTGLDLTLINLDQVVMEINDRRLDVNYYRLITHTYTNQGKDGRFHTTQKKKQEAVSLFHFYFDNESINNLPPQPLYPIKNPISELWVNRKVLPVSMFLGVYKANKQNKTQSYDWIMKNLKEYLKIVHPLTNEEETFLKTADKRKNGFGTTDEERQMAMITSLNLTENYNKLNDTETFKKEGQQTIKFFIDIQETLHLDNERLVEQLIGEEKKRDLEGDVQGILSNAMQLLDQDMDIYADMFGLKEYAPKYNYTSVKHIVIHPFFRDLVSTIMASKENSEVYRRIILQSLFFVPYSPDDVLAKIFSEYFDNDINKRVYYQKEKEGISLDDAAEVFDLAEAELEERGIDQSEPEREIPVESQYSKDSWAPDEPDFDSGKSQDLRDIALASVARLTGREPSMLRKVLESAGAPVDLADLMKRKNPDQEGLFEADYKVWDKTLKRKPPPGSHPWSGKDQGSASGSSSGDKG